MHQIVAVCGACPAPSKIIQETAIIMYMFVNALVQHKQTTSIAFLHSSHMKHQAMLSHPNPLGSAWALI